MTPLQFETAHAPVWLELEAAIAALEKKPRRRAAQAKPEGARIAAQYRQVCEHLALAQARAYPVYLTERLQTLVHAGHAVLYRERSTGLEQFSRLLLVEFPQTVRAHRPYVLLASALFVLPLLLAAGLAWVEPSFVLRLMSASDVSDLRQMYSQSEHAIGRLRDADTDFMMFGYYIMNNVGIGLRTFASGLFGGIGSIFVLVYNGTVIGGAAGHLLSQKEYAENFLSFVITHGAFELTAIVLAGTAGLRLGWSWIAPGRYTRREALRRAARHAVVLVYGVVVFLLLAAAIEAFWSSARWIAPWIKYVVGSACWLLVLGWLGWLGRPPSTKEEAVHAH